MIATATLPSERVPKRRGRVEGCPGLWWRTGLTALWCSRSSSGKAAFCASQTLRFGTTEKQAKTEWKKASAKRDEGARLFRTT